MTNYDVVKKLIGPISPTGDSGEDKRRLENLEALIALVNNLLYDINYVSRSSDSYEASVEKLGRKAHNFIQAIKELN
jgi:hypothetical protein